MVRDYLYPDYEVIRNADMCIACRVCERQCANEVHKYDADLKKMVEAYKERPRESVKGRLAEKKAEAVTQKPAQKTQSKSKSKEAEL